jgi:transcriptional regulator with XRE-family HTH domain
VSRNAYGPATTGGTGMTTDSGAWLRAQREERGWSRSDTARRLIIAARESGDKLPGADTLRKSIYRWEAGQVELSDKYRLLYCRVLSVRPAEFGSQREDSRGTVAVGPAIVQPTGAGVPFANPVAYREIETPETTQSTVRHEVLMAAHEGSEHAADAEAHGIGDATLLALT